MSTTTKPTKLKCGQLWLNTENELQGKDLKILYLVLSRDKDVWMTAKSSWYSDGFWSGFNLDKMDCEFYEDDLINWICGGKLEYVGMIPGVNELQNGKLILRPKDNGKRIFMGVCFAIWNALWAGLLWFLWSYFGQVESSAFVLYSLVVAHAFIDGYREEKNKQEKTP